MSQSIKQEITYLSSLISENKKNRILEVLEYRTRYVSVLLEDIQQPHNASAVLRSCDVFGIQDIYFIQKKNSTTIYNTIAKGAEKWVDIYHHCSIPETVFQLKKQGYRVIATTPHKQSISLQDLPLDKKMILMFGTEISGLSKQAIQAADMCVSIPMHGFTESLNISVSVAIILYDIMKRLQTSSYQWQLSNDEYNTIYLAWLKQILHIPRAR